MNSIPIPFLDLKRELIPIRKEIENKMNEIIFEKTNFILGNELEVFENNFSKYMDVNFSTNPNIAVNSQAILSGSATKAAVQDSNYTSAKQINPRYIGCTLISPTGSRSEGFVNQPMTTGSSIGALANVEQYCDWFAYFDGIQLTDYIKNTGSSSLVTPVYTIHITTLIDVYSNKIGLNSNNNIIPISTSYSSSIVVINPVTGSAIQNPLTSNIPILQNIFIPTSQASLKQYTNVTGSAASGSFNPFTILTSGFSPSYNQSPFNFDANETIIVLTSTTSSVLSNSTTPGLIIPQNFNPKYKNDLLSIAQTAGFFKTV